MSFAAIEVPLKRYNKQCEMLADLAPCKRLLQHGRASGTNYGAASHEQWKALTQALELVERVHSEIMAEVTKFRDETTA